MFARRERPKILKKLASDVFGCCCASIVLLVFLEMKAVYELQKEYESFTPRQKEFYNFCRERAKASGETSGYRALIRCRNRTRELKDLE